MNVRSRFRWGLFVFVLSLRLRFRVTYFFDGYDAPNVEAAAEFGEYLWEGLVRGYGRVSVSQRVEDLIAKVASCECAAVVVRAEKESCRDSFD